MIHFSVVAEFFQRMAQQMAAYAPRIPAIVNDGIRKMSDTMHTNFQPLDVTLQATREHLKESAETKAPTEAYGRVILELPETVVHPGVECAHCHKNPLTGMRYKCVHCESDLCQSCITLPDAHCAEHKFIPICAPAVGSHLSQSAKTSCENVKARADPVVREMCEAMSDAVQAVRVKGEGLGEKVKQQGAELGAKVKQQSVELGEKVKKEGEKLRQQISAQPQGGELTQKENEMLQQLAEMGFTDTATLVLLIRKHKNLNTVVNHLM
jgi:hypothetical protein